MAGDPNYTVSTAQQYIGQAPKRTLRRNVRSIGNRALPALPTQQTRASTESTSFDKPAPRNRLLQLSPSQFPSPFQIAALEAEAAERLRVREAFATAELPQVPGSREHSLLLAVKQDEEAEADELAAWGESLLNPEARGEYVNAVHMAAREVRALVEDIENPGSLKSMKGQSVWEEELLAPVVYAPKMAQGAERKAEIVVLAPMARTGSTKGRFVNGEEEGEVVKLAPFTYSPGSSPQLIDTTAIKPGGSKVPRHSTLDTSDKRSTTRVRFAPQTPTGSDPSVPDVNGAYEYIEASVPVGASRRGHTPNSSGGTDIYFSPVDATRSQVFLSSPQPSPTNIPGGQDGLTEKLAKIPRSEPTAPELTITFGESESRQTTQTPLSAVEAATAQLQELVLDSEGEGEEGEKVTLTLQQVDQLSVALARSPLVTKQVQKPFYDPRSELTKATTAADSASLLSEASTIVEPPPNLAPPTPPLTEQSEDDDNDKDVGGLALLECVTNGSPIKFASNGSMKVGRRTNLVLPLGSAHSAKLRIEAATHPAGESKIVLQVLEAVVDRKSGKPAFTLFSETDVSHAFVRTALTEVARARGVTLDDVEIQTPRAPSHSSASSSARSSQVSEELDWTALDSMAPPSSPSSPTTPTSPSGSLIADLTSSFASLTPETCTMATLTLLSHLSSLKRHYHTFLLLQPTRYHDNNVPAGLKVPYASQSLQERFGEPGSSIHITKSKTTPRGFFGLPGSRFRTAVVGGVAKQMAAGKEFEMLLDVAPQDEVVNRCRCQCVPLRKGGNGEGRVDMWVCMVGGEFDLTVY